MGNHEDLAEAVVDAMWDAALEGQPFHAFIEAWDTLLSEADEEEVSRLRKVEPLVHRDFARITRALDQLPSGVHYERALEQSAEPMAILSDTNRVVATNTAFDDLQVKTGAIVDALHAEEAAGEEVTYLPIRSDERSIIFQRLAFSRTAHPEHGLLYALQPIFAPWSTAGERVLKQTFSLTGSEIDIFRDLYDGLSSSEIAANRNRSPHTVRTQIKAIQEKTSITRQALMLKMAASIMLVQSGEPERIPVDTLRALMRMPDGRLVDICRYGQRGGRPVFLFSPTLDPVPGQALREASERLGLDIIVPYKPGSGRSSPFDWNRRGEPMIDDAQEILDQLGIERAVIAGQASGGVYALSFAARCPERTTGVLTLDTGYPFANLSDLTTIPPTPRRTFLLARLAPRLLLAPHKLVAADFARSTEGEERVIDYFFRDSPRDQSMVRSDPAAYDWVRSVIAYSFEDTNRLVGDVGFWMSDWSELAAAIPEEIPRHAVMGRENRLFSVAKMDEWTATSGWTLRWVEKAGEMTGFVVPDLLAVEAKRLHIVDHTAS